MVHENVVPLPVIIEVTKYIFVPHPPFTCITQLTVGSLVIRLNSHLSYMSLMLSSSSEWFCVIWERELHSLCR